MKISKSFLGSVLVMSGCSAQPAVAQTMVIGPPSSENRNTPTFVDIGKMPSENDRAKPILSLTTTLDKKGSKNITFEFGKYSEDYAPEKSGLRWQIAPGMEMKAKYKRVKFTWEF